MRYQELLEAPNRDVTKSPAFRAWFNGSKVVDRRGRPLIMYHGTHGDFHTFKSDHHSGVLAFFTTSAKFASGHAGGVMHAPGSVMPVYLRITKPFDYRDQPEGTARQFWRENGGINDEWDRWQIRIALYFDPNIEDDDNPKIVEDELSWEEFALALERGVYPALEAREFVAWLRERGYDGLVMREGGGITYAIFDPTQAKSALSNVAFNQDNPNISEGIISEGRDAPLFHACPLISAAHILGDNRINATTEQLIDGKFYPGVSLTRNIRFAFSFRHYAVAFEFDQQRLSQRFKLQPINYFSDRRGNLERHRAEAEEFLLGPLAPVSNYLRKIHLRFPTYREIEDQPEYAALVNHPLLVVRGRRIGMSGAREVWQAQKHHGVLPSI